MVGKLIFKVFVKQDYSCWPQKVLAIDFLTVRAGMECIVCRLSLLILTMPLTGLCGPDVLIFQLEGVILSGKGMVPVLEGDYGVDFALKCLKFPELL